MIPFLREAAHVRPSQRQLDWMDMGMYAFVHFSPNTYTDKEWGDGTEPESVFHPTGLDCDQWVEAIKSAGLKGMVLTAKHHDGFCLWPSQYTEHSVKNSPCKLDIVKEASEACRRGGIKFGIYLSPWDRNSKYYGTPAYNDYYCNQLTELLTGYGDIFLVWFDGACGEGPNGKKQVYDFERYFSLIRKYQPNAVIFSNGGPDGRWCGNEVGSPRPAETAVVPCEVGFHAEVQTGPGPMAEEGNLQYDNNMEQAIGTTDVILYSKGLTFLPPEYDMSIRPGWFWHENEEPHSLERLFRTYLTTVGGNGILNLNVPPTREGLLDERDVRRLKELGDKIREEFAEPIPAAVEKVSGCAPTQPQFIITLDHPVKEVKYVVLAENIAEGERVQNFRIWKNDRWRPCCYEGTTIGHRKICVLRDPFADQNPLTDDSEPEITKLTVQVTAARDEVLMKEIKVY